MYGLINKNNNRIHMTGHRGSHVYPNKVNNKSLSSPCLCPGVALHTSSQLLRSGLVIVVVPQKQVEGQRREQ